MSFQRLASLLIANRDLEMDYFALSNILPRYLRRVAFSGDSTDSQTLHSPTVGWHLALVPLPGYMPAAEATRILGDECYSMDAASCLAVKVLNIDTHRVVRILDLCCCPGSKLMLLAETAKSNSLVVGVDISVQRLQVCKSLLRTWSETVHKLGPGSSARTMVFRGDGVAYGPSQMGELVYDSAIIDEELQSYGGVKKRNKSYRARESKRLKTLQDEMQSQTKDAEGNNSIDLDDFDYVLVDAECTHDASYRHMKFIPVPADGDADTSGSAADEGGPETHPVASATVSKPSAALSHNSTYHGSSTVLSTASAELTALQRGLIRNGFDRLRPGGVMVYSTCSQDVAQNEGIVQWLLDTVGDGAAELVDVGEIIRSKCTRGKERSAGEAEHSPATACTLGTLGPAIALLQQDLPTLCQTIQREYPTVEMQRGLADALCKEVAALQVPIFQESTVLPGTVSVGYRGGMSGHFIAKIRKIESTL